jgi:PAS domain S-box-containing protein
MAANLRHKLRFQFRHWSIRTQLFLLVGALVLPLVGVLAWVLVVYLHEVRHEAQSDVMRLAQHTALQIQRHLDADHRMLERVAQRRLVQAMDPSQCDPVVSHMVALSAEFSTLTVQDVLGHTVCAFLPNQQDGRSINIAPLNAPGLDGEGFAVSEPLMSPSNARWVIALSHPVFSTDGQKSGWVRMTVDLQGMGGSVLAHVPADALVTVVHPSGVNVLRSIDAGRYIGKPTNKVAEDATRGLREGYLSIEGMDGVRRLHAFVTLPELNWRVVAGRPEAMVYAAYWQTLERVVLVGVAALALAITLAWRFGTAITQPFAQLADTAGKVATGNTQVRASLIGSSEVERVSRQFNHMLDALSQDELMLKANEQRFRTLIEWSPEPTFVHREGDLVYINPAAVRLFGAASAQALLGRSILTLVHPDFHAQTRERIAYVFTNGAGIAAPPSDIVCLRVDGTPVEVRVEGIGVYFDGQPCVLTLARDITESKRIHQALHAAVQEKVGLLNEVHHRVKNNLQVIASLLRLESRRSTLPHTKSVLDDMQGRIRSMALLHETLYRSGTFAGSALGNYLRQLSTQSFRMMLTQGEPIGLELDVCTVTVSMDQATPCGLLVNELISNCLKHAFPNSQRGKVRVSLRQVGGDVGPAMRLELQVSDNGVGLGPDFEASKSQSLGLQLVSDLARQLGGQLVVGNTGGASFTVVFSPDTLQGTVASA